MMALALKRVHNLPPYLSYVSKLPDITQKPKRDSDELKQRLTDTWGPYSSEALCIRRTHRRTLCIRRTLCKHVTIGTPMVIFAVLTVF